MLKLKESVQTMERHFDYMTPVWFRRAHLYTGSLGALRYRFKMDEENASIAAAVYSGACYEAAQNVEEQTFSWDEDGTKDLRDWLEAAYEKFSA